MDTDTPNVTEEPLWTVAVSASEAVVEAVKVRDLDGADEVTAEVWGRLGDPGVFALCCGLVAGVWAPGPVRSLSFAVMDPDGSVRSADIETVPYPVRFVGRFIACVTSMDVDMAWAHWLSIPNHRSKQMIVAYLATMAAAIEDDRGR